MTGIPNPGKSFAGGWFKNSTDVGVNETNANRGIDEIRLKTVLGDTSNDPVDAVTYRRSPPMRAGVQVDTYADRVAAFTRGTTIAYDGAAGTLDFNQCHNTFGDFSISQLDIADDTHAIFTISGADLQKFEPAS